MLSLANVYAQESKYDIAIKLYTQLLKKDTPSLAQKRNDIVFNLILCLLNTDNVFEINHIISTDPTFKDSPEYAFFNVLVDHIQQKNILGFMTTIRDYGAKKSLDGIKTTLLLRIKTRFMRI